MSSAREGSSGFSSAAFAPRALAFASVVAVTFYAVAGLAEATLIRVLQPSELELDWDETGGPPVTAPPALVGFGSRLTRATVVQLDGKLEQVWRPEGLLIRLKASLERCEPPRRRGAA